MLVLSRHRDESIIIPLTDGVRLRITVIEIRGDKVRIGIDAPPNIPVNREEVQAQIDAGIPQGGRR